MELATANSKGEHMDLIKAKEGLGYLVECVQTGDEELDSFLFSLGCYNGQEITVVSKKKSFCVVAIKDARYTIDNQLARAIKIVV